MSKNSTIRTVLTESYRLVEDNRNLLWEWICEMQSEQAAIQYLWRFSVCRVGSGGLAIV